VMTPDEQPVTTAANEPVASTQRSHGDGEIDRRAVLRGAVLGLAILAVASVIVAILDHDLNDFRNSGWIYVLFLVVLAGYVTAGWYAGRAVPSVPLTNGSLAGLGAFVLWIPVRVVIWAARNDGRGLFGGTRAALPPGQVFGQVVIAVGLGMLGGYIGARRAQRSTARAATDSSTGGAGTTS